MKKILAILITVIFSTQIYAQQSSFYHGFRLGLTAHPTLGYVKPKTGKSNGVNLGFSYGLMGDFNFASNYSFSTGLTITTINGKGTEINPPHYHEAGNANKTSYDIKYMMQYIEIPLTIKLKTDQFGEIRWYGQFGLSTNFAIGSKQDASSAGTILANGVDASSWTNFFRAGMIIGGGLEYDLNQRTSLVFGASLNNGFTNIATGANVRNHYVGINAGVFF